MSPGPATAGPGTLKPYITTKDLNSNSKQYDPKELADYGDAGWPQYFFDQVNGTEGEKYKDQVDKDGYQDIIGIIVGFQRHHSGKCTRACYNREGNRHHVPRLAIVLMPEEVEAQYHLQAQYEYNNRPCYGKRMDIKSHKVEHLLTNEEKCEYQGARNQGRLRGADVAHLFLQPNYNGYGAQHIYHRKEGEAERNYLRKV